MPLESGQLPLSCDVMVAEREHKKGEEGAQLIKRWLESTTYVTINFTAYEDEAQTSVQMLDGRRKRYDLAGYFLGDFRRPLFVEVKNYDVRGRQPEEYDQFLANAYSATAAGIADGMDLKREFMWVTWHPFAQGKWAKLTSEEEIRAALDRCPEVLGGHTIDEKVVRNAAERLWLVVLSRRQEEFLLTRAELMKIHGAIERKGMM